MFYSSKLILFVWVDSFIVLWKYIYVVYVVVVELALAGGRSIRAGVRSRRVTTAFDLWFCVRGSETEAWRGHSLGGRIDRSTADCKWCRLVPTAGVGQSAAMCASPRAAACSRGSPHSRRLSSLYSSDTVSTQTLKILGSWMCMHWLMWTVTHFRFLSWSGPASSQGARDRPTATRRRLYLPNWSRINLCHDTYKYNYI